MKERKRPHRVFGMVILSGVTAVIGAVVMLLWNWLMPEIFGLKSVSYLQAVGLLVLSKILFSGFSSIIVAGMAIGHHYHRHDAGDRHRREMLRRLTTEDISDDNESSEE